MKEAHYVKSVAVNSITMENSFGLVTIMIPPYFWVNIFHRKMKYKYLCVDLNDKIVQNSYGPYRFSKLK